MFAEDIEKRILKLFGAQSDKAKEILQKLQDPTGSQLRIIRCVLVLSGGDINKLEEAINFAIIDYRDVINGAEYDKGGNRIANYNNPFR
jgi:hypothetical protein